MQPIGIMGAMPQEIDGIRALIQHPEEHHIGQRVYTTGTINNTPVVVVFSRWGKVAAASTVTTLIQQFHVQSVVFTGVAGGVGSSVGIGDVVIGSSYVQHDMDARPLMAQFEIPLLEKTAFMADSDLVARAHHVLLERKEAHQATYQIHQGVLASGDQFFATSDQINRLRKDLPDVLGVEMEGAAVAQVCYEMHVPFVVIRIISDNAAEGAAIDFDAFIEQEAKIRTAEFIAYFI